jgi:hypothetical protein
MGSERREALAHLYHRSGIGALINAMAYVRSLYGIGLGKTLKIEGFPVRDGKMTKTFW